MSVLKIKDNESYILHKDVLNSLDQSHRLDPSLFVTLSRKHYGIFNEKYGWVKEITIVPSSREVNVSYSYNKEDALSIVGSIIQGRILLFGNCILL